MIPKIAFSFWEGDQFTYLHYITIVSFLKFNPDFRVIIYRSRTNITNKIKWLSGEQEGLSYTNTLSVDELGKLPNVELIDINVNAELNYSGELTSVWKSDIIRVLKLYEHGGFYIDFDTLFINKIPDFLLNMTYDFAVNTYHNVINNAFIAAKKGSYICKVLLDAIRQKLCSNNIQNIYMQFGPILYTQILYNNQEYEKYIYYIPNVMTCPYLWYEMDKLFYSNTCEYNKDTFCLHWYNGALMSRRYCAQFRLENIDPTRCIFEKLLMEKFIG